MSEHVERFKAQHPIIWAFLEREFLHKMRTKIEAGENLTGNQLAALYRIAKGRPRPRRSR